jgi:hypothetical protein
VAICEVHRNRRPVVLRSGLAAGIATAFGVAFSASARAGTITVDSLADTGAPGICVLRDAITGANTKAATNGCAAGTGNDTIRFGVTGTISLASTLPQITDTLLTINGPASPGITIDGGHHVQVMQVAFGVMLNLNHLTIANGSSPFSGGGISNGGTLTVTNSTFSGNYAEDSGGGIANGRTLTVTNCTFSLNSAGDSGGGGISNGGTLTVTNSTFSGNGADQGGGDIANGTEASIISIRSTVLAGSGDVGNCAATIIDTGYNISDDPWCAFSSPTSRNNTDPMLDPAGLSNNGGPTQTIALLEGSPAIDAIPLADCIDKASPPNPIITDQRNFPRPDDGEGFCDIGAFEIHDTPFVRFSRFSGGAMINSATNLFSLYGGFKLKASSSIDPTTQPVALRIGTFALRLPAGAFSKNNVGYVYQKTINGAFLRFYIQFTSAPGSYALFVARQDGSALTGNSGPLPVTLTIGNNSGTTRMYLKTD